MIRGKTFTCDSVGDAKEAGLPVATDKWLPVVAVTTAHAKQLLPYSFIPQPIYERMTGSTHKWQPAHHRLQSWWHASSPPYRLGADHYHIRPPSHQEGADHHQNSDQGFTLASSVDQTSPAPDGRNRGGGVLSSIPIGGRGLLNYHNRPAVHLASFVPCHTEDEAVAHQHGKQWNQAAPRYPEGSVAGVTIPGHGAGLLEMVKLKCGPAKQRRQAAHQRMQPQVDYGHCCTIACDLDRVDHREQHGIVPDRTQNMVSLGLDIDMF